MSNVTFIEVNGDQDGQRLDRILKAHLPGTPFGLIQKLLRTGQVRVDSKRCKTSTRVEKGQMIRIPPIEQKEKDGKAILRDKDVDFMKSLVIFEDKDVLAINKPYGLAVQGGTGTRYHLDALLEAFVSKKNPIKPRLVHRLDKETSGVMVLAKSANAARALGAAFKGRGIKKVYWALTSPAPEHMDGEIRAPLVKALSGSKKEKMIVDEEEGKASTTEFQVIERAGDSCAFVAFWPRSGRTHQIRAHAEYMGAPLIGDNKYGEIDNYEHVKQKSDLEGLKIADRLHLHARRLVLEHPLQKGKTLDLKAALPDDLKQSWSALGFDYNFDDSDIFQ